MKVYHGSTVIVEKPNMKMSNYETSFGKGFYTSIDKDTAEYWAEAKKQQLLGEDKNLILKKYVNVYEFTENENLNILDFNKVDELYNEFIEKNKKSSELLHNYDIVKGSEITEDFVRFLEDYKQKKIKKEDLLNTLTIYKTINEISFYTEKSIKTLKFLYAEEIKQSKHISLC